MIYIGNTSRSLKQRPYEHQCDIRLGNLITHFSYIYPKLIKNLFFHAATILAYIHNKRLRKFLKQVQFRLIICLDTSQAYQFS